MNHHDDLAIDGSETLPGCAFAVFYVTGIVIYRLKLLKFNCLSTSFPSFSLLNTYFHDIAGTRSKHGHKPCSQLSLCRSYDFRIYYALWRIFIISTLF